MEKNNKTTEKVRIQLELTPAMSAKLEQLVERTGISTRAEVLRRAISIFALLLDEEKAGNRIELVEGDSRKRLIIA